MHIVGQTSTGKWIVEVSDLALSRMREQLDPNAICMCCQERPSRGRIYCTTCSTSINRHLSFGLSPVAAVAYTKANMETARNLERAIAEHRSSASGASRSGSVDRQ